MEVQKIIKMCEGISRRFNRPHLKEDMISEGVLKALEILSVEPDAPPVKLYREIKRRMYDYVNLNCHGLSIPPSDAARAVSRGNETSDRGDYSERGLEALRAALQSEWGEFDDDTYYCGKEVTPEQTLIDKQTSHALTAMINDHLSETEAELVILRYFEDATQDEVGSILGLSQKSVSIWEKKALRKLRLQACNNL